MNIALVALIPLCKYGIPLCKYSLARAYGRTRTAAWAFPSTAARHCCAPTTPIATRVAFACCSVVSDNYGLPYAANLHFLKDKLNRRHRGYDNDSARALTTSLEMPSIPGDFLSSSFAIALRTPAVVIISPGDVLDRTSWNPACPSIHTMLFL